MIRYLARLNPEKLSEDLLNRQDVLQLSDVGAQLGFGLSVLQQRRLVRAATTALEPEGALPLLTWPFLDFLESLDLSELRLLELGAGNSTLWFQERFARVRSLETNREWHEALSRSVAQNVELELVELGALERGLVDYRGEDLILVDFAGHRTRFLNAFLARLAGPRPPAIVLDNADWYRNGARSLTRHGYQEIPFHGFKSGQPFLSCTSLFIDPERFRPRVRDPFFRPAFSKRFSNDWDEP